MLEMIQSFCKMRIFPLFTVPLYFAYSLHGPEGRFQKLRGEALAPMWPPCRPRRKGDDPVRTSTVCAEQEAVVGWFPLLGLSFA